MSNIFIINPLQSTGRSSYFPIGLMMLATFLRNNGIKISFFDRNACFHGLGDCNIENCDKIMLAELSKSGATIVGITMMTGHFTDVKHVAECLKKSVPNISLVVGGTHPTFEFERTLQQIPHLDVVVRGPGEIPCLQLCRKNEMLTIPNIVFRDGQQGKFFSTPIKRSIRFNWSQPAYDLVDAEFYWNDDFYHTNSTHIPGLAMMMTSQGCPGKCTFCVDDRFLGNGFYQPDEQIFEEMDELQTKYGRKAYFFVDRDFRLGTKKLFTFCQKKLHSSQKNAPWTATIRADQVNEPLAAILKESNCIRIVLGLEAGSQRILNLLKKGTTVAQNYYAVNILNKYKILTCGSFIYGLPGQTVEDLQTNIAFFRSVHLFDSAVLIFLPTVGSPLYNELVALGRLNPDDITTWEKTIDFNIKLSPKRNYSDIPFQDFKSIFQQHANEIFTTCNGRRKKLLEEYNLSQYFDYQ